MKSFIKTIASFAVILTMAGCKNCIVGTHQMAGTMEEPLPSCVIPDSILDIRLTRQPMAKYNAKTGDVWLTTSAMEGTGVHVDWLHQIRFGEDNKAFVKAEVNPYDVQQELLKRLCYTIDSETITLYDGEQQLATVTNTVTDMGGFDDEQPLWIGEQLYYDVSGDEPKVVFVPGVKFTTGLVLFYDDMPELTAPITIDENGKFIIHEISVKEAPSISVSEEMAFEGVNNYCHSAYDWSAAKDNPDIMYLTMGEETDSAYQLVFRSYTGAFVHFYVDKSSGTTRIVEKVPSLNVEEEAGTIDLFDYLETQK